MQIDKTFKTKPRKSYEEWLDKFMPSRLNDSDINQLEQHLVHQNKSNLFKPSNNPTYEPLFGA